MATRYQIAKLAGVSAATVTNVLNHTKNVSPEVREQVMNAAQQLDYTVTHKTKKGSPRKISLVVDNCSNPHYGQIYDGMNEVAQKNGCMVSMIEMGYDTEQFCQDLLRSGTDAIFLTVPRDQISPQQIQHLQMNGIVVGNSQESFQMDFNDAYFRLVKHLVDLGHKRILYLSGLSLEDEANMRWKAYERAVRQCGAEDSPDLLVDGFFPYETNMQNGYQIMKARLAQKLDFTAVIALNDLMAIGAMHAITEHGLRIPEDISVIGCDDVPVSEFVNPPLTTLHVPAKEIGRRTMYDILSQFENKPIGPIHLPIDIIFRKSVGATKKDV